TTRAISGRTRRSRTARQWSDRRWRSSAASSRTSSRDEESPAMTASEIQTRLRAMGDPAAAAAAARFFKTGSGEYGEGDVFLGLRADAMRRLSREYRGLPLPEA